MGRPPKQRGKGEGSRGRPPLDRRGEPPPPPDEERCARNDGKSWRCQERKMPYYRLCEVHYEQSARRAARAKALNARGRGGTTRRGGRGRPPSRVESFSQLKDKKRLRKDMDEKFPLRKKAKGEHSGKEKNLQEEKAQPLSMVNKKIEKSYKRKPPNGPNALMCHQCQRNDKGRVIYCSNCERNRYCIPCIERWYPLLTEMEISKKCPFCSHNCNCKMCLRMKQVEQPSKKKLTQDEKVRHYSYLLNLVLPFFKEMLLQQIVEIETEAKIKGIAPHDLKLQQVDCEEDERIFWRHLKLLVLKFWQVGMQRKDDSGTKSMESHIFRENVLKSEHLHW